MYSAGYLEFPLYTIRKKDTCRLKYTEIKPCEVRGKLNYTETTLN